MNVVLRSFLLTLTVSVSPEYLRKMAFKHYVRISLYIFQEVNIFCSPGISKMFPASGGGSSYFLPTHHFPTGKLPVSFAQLTTTTQGGFCVHLECEMGRQQTSNPIATEGFNSDGNPETQCFCSMREASWALVLARSYSSNRRMEQYRSIFTRYSSGGQASHPQSGNKHSPEILSWQQVFLKWALQKIRCSLTTNGYCPYFFF